MPAIVGLCAMTAGAQRAVTKLAHARTAPARLVDRARIILAAAEGLPVTKIAAGLGYSWPTVYAWIRRFNDRGLQGLQERPHSGRPHTYPASSTPRSCLRP